VRKKGNANGISTERQETSKHTCCMQEKGPPPCQIGDGFGWRTWAFQGGNR